MWDEDASVFSGNMQVRALASRGGFTNPERAGLTYIVGEGNQDPLTQTFLCSYAVCRRALRELRYQSADTPGSDVITVFVNDLGNSGELGAQEGSGAPALFQEHVPAD